MDPNKIPQCEQCRAALVDGYAEVTTALEEKRMRLCFSCAIEDMRIKRALHADDLLAAGMMEDDHGR